MPTRARLYRVLTWTAVAIWCVYAAYVLGVNLFLSTSLFEKVVDADPQTVFISYARGWSIWPGRVHARHLTIRSSDTKVEFVLRIERCTFDVSLTELLAKRFHVTQVEGEGVAFQARRRIEAPAATLEYVASLPPIPGFERIPLRSQKPLHSPEEWDDRAYHLWTIHLEKVVAEDVREIWIDGVRFEGAARVTGGFFLKPIRRVRVEDVHVEVRAGRVTALQRPAVDAMAGTASIDVKPFDPRSVRGADLLHRVSLTTDLHGRSADLANLPPSLTSPARVAGPAEWRSVAVRIADGKLGSGSHVDIELPEASVSFGEHRLSGTSTLRAEVADVAGQPQLALHFDARALTAARVHGGTPAVLLDVPALEVVGDARALDLAAPLRDLHLAMRLAEGQLRDARVLDGYLPAGSFGFDSGRAQATANVELWLADRRARGELRLVTESLVLRVGKLRVGGAATLDASFGAWRWDDRSVEDVRGHLWVETGAVAVGGAPDRPVLDVRKASMDLVSAALDLDDPLRAFHARLEVPEGEVTDRGTLTRYLPHATDLRIVQGRARFDARCEVDVEDHHAGGTLALRAPQLRVTRGDLSLVAAVRAQGRLLDWAFAHGDVASGDARVDLTDVDLRRRGRSEPVLAVASLTLRARSNRFVFHDPLAHLALGGSIAGGRVHDATALNALMAPAGKVGLDVDPADGRFDGRVDATFEAHVARGEASAHGYGVGVRSATLRVRGDVDATATVEGWELDHQRLRVPRSRIALDKISVSLAGATSPDLRARHIELRARTGALDLGQPSLAAVDYRLTVEDARMPNLRRLGVLLDGAPGSSAFAIESGEARGAADITVSGSEKSASGGATLSVDRAGIRFHKTHLTGDLRVVAKVRGLDGDRVDLAGSTVALTSVQTVGATAATTAWSGEATLLGGAVLTSPGPAFDGLVQLHADDARPILALTLGTSLPSFLVGLLRAPDLSGQAHITAAPGRTAIRDARVRGGDVVLLANYVVAGEHARGAISVAKGPLSAGVKIDDAGTHVRLFGLDAWMRETRAALEVFGTSTAKDAGGAP